MPYTLGFPDKELLAQHFDEHHIEFGVATEDEYELLADTFLGGPLDDGALECIRGSNGDVIRYNRLTDEFGVRGTDGFIRTYFKPNPIFHRQPTNLDYFRKECNR